MDAMKILRTYLSMMRVGSEVMRNLEILPYAVSICSYRDWRESYCPTRLLLVILKPPETCKKLTLCSLESPLSDYFCTLVLEYITLLII